MRCALCYFGRKTRIKKRKSEELDRSQLLTASPTTALLPPGVPNGVGLLSHLRQPGQHPDWRGRRGVGDLRGVRVGQQQQPPAGGGDAGEDPAAQAGGELRRRTDGERESKKNNNIAIL